MSDNSAKPILIAGAVGTVALLGVAWNFTANVSEQAVVDAQQFAEQNSSPVVAELSTMPEEPALPEPEAEEVAATEEAAAEEVEVAEEAAPEVPADAEQEEVAEAPAPEMVVGTAPRTVEEKPKDEAEVTDIEVVPADDDTEVAEAEAAPAEEAEVAEAEEAPADEADVAEAEETPAAEPEVAEAEEAAPEETETAANETAPAGLLASIEGDAAAGKKVFRKCQACHQVGDGAKNRVGPQLNMVMGRVMASVEGFNYSDGFVAANEEGRVWTVAEMDAWLEKPRDFMPGTKMAFGGLRKEADRVNVIAYMAEEGGVTEMKEASAAEAEETKVAAAETPAAAEQAPAETAEAESSEAVEDAAEAEAATEETTEVAEAEAEPAEEVETAAAEEAAPEEAAAAAAPAAATEVASIDGDAKAGKRVWRKCQACHKMGDGAKNAVGPQLNNIIGRTIGSVDGFKYSDGFVALNDEGKVWTVEALDAWLTKPRDYIAGTKMAFGGLRKEDDRKNVIAYMAEEGQ